MKEFIIKIKTLTIDNYDQMMNLWKGAGLESRPRGRDSKKSIKAQMEVNPEFFIRAFIDNKLIGTVIASSDGRKGWINRLAVSPEHRQQGIAKALIAEAERILRKNGIRIFSALIMEDNQASKELFKKLGYKELEDVKYFSKKESREV
jgi:ribosomal protein S18 acetylase RimI-like enzyme